MLLPKRRKRRGPPPISAEALFWTLAVLNITAGCFLSPITSLTKLTVAGVHPDSEAQVRSDMEKLGGMPYALLHRGWVEDRLLLDGSAEALAWKGNIFGRATFTLKPREAAARVIGKGFAPDLVIDARGTLFRAVAVDPDLPQINVPERAREATGMLLSGWEAATAGAFASAVRGEVKGSLASLTIHVSEDSSFFLELEDKVLELGALESIDEGVEVAKSFLESSKEVKEDQKGSSQKDQSASGQADTDQTMNDPSKIIGGTSGTNPQSSPKQNG